MVYRNWFISLVILLASLALVSCSSSTTNKGGAAAPSTSTPANAGSPSETSEKPQQAGDSPRNFPPAVAEVLEAGKKEGKVNFFGVTADPGQVKEFETAISEFYGFPIQLSMSSGLHPQKAAELISAAKSGVKSGIDIFHSSPNTLIPLFDANLIADADWVSDFALDDSYKLLDGKVVRTTDRFLAGVIYNTDLVSEEEAPKTYDDLLDPKWKGKIIMPRSTSPLAFVAGAIGEDYAKNLVEGLSNQDITFTPTYPDVNARVGSGEFMLGIGIEAERDIRSGAPEATAPINPVIITPWGNAPMKDAEHPNAAKLVSYFMITPEGQHAMDEIFAVALSDYEGTSANKLVQGLDKKFVSDDFIRNRSDDLRMQYAEILGMN